MPETLPILMENSIQIAWDYLGRTGQREPENREPVFTRHGRADGSSGERRSLMLSNKTIQV
jgi:hypothetical protein